MSQNKTSFEGGSCSPVDKIILNLLQTLLTSFSAAMLLEDANLGSRLTISLKG